MSAINLPGSPFAFDGIMVFCWISVFLLFGMIVRYKIPFFRKFLIPACILGGLGGLIIRSTGCLAWTGLDVSNAMFQIVIFHLFNLTWVFLGLKKPEKNATQPGQNVKLISYVFLINVAVVSVLGALSIAAGFGLNAIGQNPGPISLGLITTTGFTGGPGQALTVSGVWGQVSGLAGLNDFALASSSAGYLVAILLGIPVMNIIARRKKLALLTSPAKTDQDGFYEDYDCAPSTCRDTTVTTNIDTLAFHMALGLGAYFTLVLLLRCVITYLPASVLPLVWGAFFLLCYISGFLIRFILTRFKKDSICCNNVNNKISNSLVDFLVCGTFISIEMGSIGIYLVPLVVMSIICSVTVLALCWFSFGKFTHESAEYFAFTFGTWTGTISTGLILTRMVDPESKSSVPVNFGVANAFLMPYVVFATFLMHMELVYKYNPVIPMLIYFAVGVLTLMAAKFVRVEKNKRMWE